MLIGFGYKHTFMHNNDLQLIREAYVNNSDVFSNRPALINPMQEREKGLIMRNGRDWKMIRRFTLKTLKDFGVGKPFLEKAIQVYIY